MNLIRGIRTGLRHRPLRQASRALREVLFPSLCPACRAAPGPDICDSCLSEWQTVIDPCPYCGAPLGAAVSHTPIICPRCHNTGIGHVRGVQVLGVYRGILAKLIGDAKAGAHNGAVQALAKSMAERIHLPEPHVTIIPLPPNRGRREGPHLATACAKAVARTHQRPLQQALRTTRTAAEQHRLLAHQRQQAVRDLFRCTHNVSESILLIDDILTSGSTLAAAARCLRQAGARRIWACCLARSVDSRDPRPAVDAGTPATPHQ
ncbi:MAG: ComF family protein [Planctomycetota bacterium]|nr:MAG: ComF family protein [Planctomycetota bacterium]